MSQLEVLNATSSLDFDFTKGETRPVPIRSQEESFGVCTGTLSASPIVTRSLTDARAESDDEISIANLPPLFRGHAEVHLRNGVMRASRLAALHETDAEKAFFVSDLSYVYRQHERWKRCLPEVEPFYGTLCLSYSAVHCTKCRSRFFAAVKCNPDPYVLRLLAGLGTGFDCASNNEIARVLELGIVDPSRIIFANPCKATSFIRNAAKSGVDMMTFDNADELHKIARTHPSAKLVVRILTDDSKSLCRLGLKFGAPLVAVPGLLAKAQELGLNVIGVSFHVGSGSYDPSAFADAIARARAAFDMGTAAGYTFTLLDVGGGFEDATFEANAAVLSEAIVHHFPDRGSIRVIAEPGRFYVSKAFHLAANIIARRAPIAGDACQVDEEANAPSVMCTCLISFFLFFRICFSSSLWPSLLTFHLTYADYINDGVYGSFNCILFDHQVVHPYVLSMGGSFHIPSSEPLRLSSVWGPTCDSIDCVCPTTQLPQSLAMGDWLAFENMGAYTVCAASQFNGFEVSNVIYTSGGGAGSAEVRRALAAFSSLGGSTATRTCAD